MHPTTSIPTDIRTLLERESAPGLWDALSAQIPAWHPRNEGEGGGGGDGGGASATAAQPAAAQPGGEGRGDVDHLAGLYDLSAAPESLRPYLQDELRKINTGVGRRFQEHADFRQRFEPLAEIDGLTDTPPEDLQDLLAIHNMIVQAADEQNPNDDALYQWWEQLGEHFGFHGDGSTGDEPGGQAAADPGGETEPPQWASGLVDRLEAIEQRLDGTERTTAAQQAEQQVATEMKALADQHGLDETAQTTVLQLAYSYNGADDALQKGLADYFRISGKAESELLDAGGATRPGPTTPSGGQVPASGTDGPMRLGDKRLRSAAVARLQGQSTGAAA